MQKLSHNYVERWLRKYVERWLRKCFFCPNGQIVEVCFGKVNITSQIQPMNARFSALVSGIELYFIQGGFLTVLPLKF